jgi:hypothetical protein
MHLSQQFLNKLRLSAVPAYKLAWEVGLHPNTLSKFVIGYLKPKPFDERLLRIGELLGMDRDEVFEVDKDA